MQFNDLISYLRSLPDDQAQNEYSSRLMETLLEMGLNDHQAKTVSYRAYERGHSAGWDEIVCVAQSEAEHALELLKITEPGDLAELKSKAFKWDEISTHLNPIIDAITHTMNTVTPDSPETPESDGRSDQSYWKHELDAIQRLKPTN